MEEGVHIRQNTSAHVTTIMYFNRAWVNISSNPRQSLHLYRVLKSSTMHFFYQKLIGL